MSKTSVYYYKRHMSKTKKRRAIAVPRPRKCRKVCCLPKVSVFRPEGGAEHSVTLTVDEYETLRLIDREGFSQAECAGYMQVARTTVQQVYNTARQKTAAEASTQRGKNGIIRP